MLEIPFVTVKIMRAVISGRVANVGLHATPSHAGAGDRAIDLRHVARHGPRPRPTCTLHAELGGYNCCGDRGWAGDARIAAIGPILDLTLRAVSYQPVGASNAILEGQRDDRVIRDCGAACAKLRVRPTVPNHTCEPRRSEGFSRRFLDDAVAISLRDDGDRIACGDEVRPDFNVLGHRHLACAHPGAAAAGPPFERVLLTGNGREGDDRAGGERGTAGLNRGILRCSATDAGGTRGHRTRGIDEAMYAQGNGLRVRWASR